MRQRTTWKQTPRSASTERRADDLYTMNRDGGNPQPAVDEYESGDPSTWAEDVNSGSSVEKEYAGGAVKRNEIGFPEFREDTFNHAGTRPWGKGGQYDNARLAAQRKAVACERVARAILRTDDVKLIEATTMDLMSLPAKALVATIKRMDQISPSSLSENSRYRRALACTKLSALLLTEEAEEEAIERLATLFNSIDDSTLKGILSVVATSRVSGESSSEEDESVENKDETDETEEPKETTAAEKSSAEEQKEQGEEENEEEGVLTDADLDKLKEMMENVVETAEAAEAEVEAQGGDVDDLQQLFEGEDEEAGQAPAGQTSNSPVDITFDEGEEETAGTVSMASDLDGLFDTDENVAQRELRAAQASNFNQRTASSKGAKKLGQVRAAKSASVDENLEALWDRPAQ
jgi:hypothetical protein